MLQLSEMIIHELNDDKKTIFKRSVHSIYC